MERRDLTTKTIFLLTISSICFVTAPTFAKPPQKQVQLDTKYVTTQNQQLNSHGLTLTGLEKRVNALESTQKKNSLVKSGNDRFNVKLSGQINQAALYAYDGKKDYMFYGNVQNSSSKVKVVGKAKVNDDTSIITTVVIGLKNNSSEHMGQTNQSPGKIFDFRKAEVAFASKRFGRLSIGQGDTASNKTAEVDLSGTSVMIGSPVQYFGGELLFRNKTTGMLSKTDIGDAFNNLDGLSRKTRVRYDTPSVAGFSLSGSAIENDTYDGAIRFNHKCSWAKFAAAFAYSETQALSKKVKGDGIDGSGSILFNNGLNATIASGEVFEQVPGRKKDPYYGYVKLGYLAKIFSIGSTALSADAGHYWNYVQDNDRGDTLGGAVLQNISKWHTGLYVGYRYIKLKRPGSSFYPINEAMTGAIVKF